MEGGQKAWGLKTRGSLSSSHIHREENAGHGQDTDLGKERDQTGRGSCGQLGTEEKRQKGGNGLQDRGGPQVTTKTDTLDGGLLAYLDKLDRQKRVLFNQESHKTFSWQ